MLQSLVELCRLAIGAVRDGPDLLSSTLLDLGSHVKLAHRDDLDTPGFVVIGDDLGTQVISLLNMLVITRMVEGTDLGGVLVELDGAVRLEVRFKQSPVRFRRNGDNAATAVIGTLQGRQRHVETVGPTQRDAYREQEGRTRKT